MIETPHIQYSLTPCFTIFGDLKRVISEIVFRRVIEYIHYPSIFVRMTVVTWVMAML